MIFHEHKTIFLHPGKTAGSSIEQMLLPGHNLDPYAPDRHQMFGWDGELGIFLQHAVCRVVREMVGPKLYETYFKFTVARDPYTRMVSVYYYLFELHQARYGSFREFILRLPELTQGLDAMRGTHLTAQVHYSHIRGVQAVDHIGRFERLEETVSLLMSRCAVTLELPRVNTAVHPMRPGSNGGQLYDEEMIAVMQAVYREDFDIFGYSDRSGASA